MRTLIFTVLLSLPVMTSSSGIPDGDVLLAGAVEASVTRPQELHMEDNYGDPSRFVKYYIRRPPALA